MPLGLEPLRGGKPRALHAKTTIVGRAANAFIRLRSPYASRRHAQIDILDSATGKPMCCVSFNYIHNLYMHTRIHVCMYMNTYACIHMKIRDMHMFIY
jgi:hypothetical protein